MDRPLIAAVVENRLRDDMPLQIDATLLYARGSRVGPITDADYQLDSPYNTYRNLGLPPTPISTVTTASLARRAAPGRRAVQVLRAERREREAHVRDDLRGAPAQRRSGPREGPVGVSGALHVTGATRLAAVIGDPVRHSRSPRSTTRRTRRRASTGSSSRSRCVPAGATTRCGRCRVLGIAGLSVTMPHKADAARACDELSADAATLEVVNTVVLRDDGTLWGDSTDGEGLLRSLTDAGLDVDGRRVLVVGAGGAARAAVLALGRAGARVDGRGPAAGGRRRSRGARGRVRDRRARRESRRPTSTWSSTRRRSAWPARRCRSTRPARASGPSTSSTTRPRRRSSPRPRPRGPGSSAGSGCSSTRPRSGSRP